MPRVKPTYLRKMRTALGYTASALTACLLWDAGARADEIDRDKARITTRSDVIMSIESGHGVSGSKLNKLAELLGTPLGDVKRCYGKIIKESPGVQGQIDVELNYGEKGPLQVGIKPHSIDNAKLQGCVRRTFQALKLNQVGRPANAVVKLEFNNSAADAAHHVAAKREEMAQVDVKTTAEGKLYSEDATEDGKLSFRVTAMGNSGEAAVTAAHHGMEHALARLLDCRRRSGKNASPAGEISFNVDLRGKGKPKIDALTSSVEHQWAKSCSLGALRRAKFDKGVGRLRVVVTFHDSAARSAAAE